MKLDWIVLGIIAASVAFILVIGFAIFSAIVKTLAWIEIAVHGCK